MIDGFFTVFMGATLFYARPDALKGTLPETMKYVKPTLFLGVPRVWEKMQEKVTNTVAEASNLKQKIFRWATKNGFEYTSTKFEKKTKSRFGFWLADKIVLRKVRAQMGLDQAKFVYSGAAPINRKTLEFITGIGLPICETFGMSESTGFTFFFILLLFVLGNVHEISQVFFL
jgi:long-chain-fatty-acid--CoA ligase ACSBG